MKELEYPFDAEYILQKKKKIKRELLSVPDAVFLDKKIAVLGGSTTSDIIQVMELFLLHYGIRPAFYESEYNQYYQDAVFPNEELKAFMPDVIYVCTSNRNIVKYPSLSDTAEEVDAMLEAEMQKYTQIWESLAEKYHCPVIQNNFEMPYYRLMGNRDAYDIHGKGNFLSRLNQCFYFYAQTHPNFYLCDINYISADYGLKEWSDPFYWHMYKYAVAVPAIPYLSFQVANIIKALYGKNKKGFVLDLDNTLWGGVVGDDGVDGLALGPEEPEGQAYSEFQRYIKEHAQMGVLLNVDSKNDRENAIAGIKHPDSAFSEEDFIVIKANWDSKDKNFKEIADTLNLLPESLVFIDDNPAERHIVAGQFPGVCAPEITDVSHYIGIIDRSGFFETTDISGDDLKRVEMYQENAHRKELEGSFTDYGEYLRSLDMKAEIKAFEPLYMARIAQLTNKSNQFNLTTKRYTLAEIEAASADPTQITLYGKLADRFGDNGLVSVVIGHVSGETCHIGLWLMSCRVLKRDMEFAMMDELVKECTERGVKEIIGYYYPTAKNKMVENFYELQGFEKISSDEQGNTVWRLSLAGGYQKKNAVIQIEKEQSI